MARNREKKHPSLVYQVEMKLKYKLAIGHSKYDDQREERKILKEKRKESLNKELPLFEHFLWRVYLLPLNVTIKQSTKYANLLYYTYTFDSN